MTNINIDETRMRVQISEEDKADIVTNILAKLEQRLERFENKLEDLEDNQKATQTNIGTLATAIDTLIITNRGRT